MEHAEEGDDDPGDGAPHGELLGLLRGILSTGHIPHGPFVVDLGGEDAIGSGLPLGADSTVHRGTKPTVRIEWDQ